MFYLVASLSLFFGAFAGSLVGQIASEPVRKWWVRRGLTEMQRVCLDSQARYDATMEASDAAYRKTIGERLDAACSPR